MALESIQSKKVAILGYGNQGRAHAANLRDCGVEVLVGARETGRAWGKAIEDGFLPVSFSKAVREADVVMFLLPDTAISTAYAQLESELSSGPKWVGFAHGFSFQFGQLKPLPTVQFFLVAPKGAGSVLRARFCSGEGLPTVFAVAAGSTEATRHIAESYARAIARGTSFLKETTFQIETEGDLFAEQVVLVGGVMELMRNAFQTLVENGHPPEMAFFDTCQELTATLDLFINAGPSGMLAKISPTALYGAATRGPRVVPPETRATMQLVFDEIRSGAFARELQSAGEAALEKARSKESGSLWDKTYLGLKPYLESAK
jgi:ketol-acid reductoisomerase